MSRQKIFRGRIVDWEMKPTGQAEADLYGPNLGYVIVGDLLTISGAGDNRIQTSLVVAHDARTGIVETLNSIYQVIS
jgi:hypothetical protein